MSENKQTLQQRFKTKYKQHLQVQFDIRADMIVRRKKRNTECSQKKKITKTKTDLFQSLSLLTIVIKRVIMDEIMNHKIYISVLKYKLAVYSTFSYTKMRMSMKPKIYTQYIL